ncbi:hypothetical protein [Nonomuraea turkmeniaca]|uniref:hypothetical protein n=1 Tax=Nonomuraea turkmeniaca TaxID=103838 RepID=UPI001B87ABEA|nr:hypothetical protein [Nonomuraea turkmeniaca]
MAASVAAAQQAAPAAIAAIALDGPAAGTAEIVADEISGTVKAGLSAPVTA